MLLASYDCHFIVQATLIAIINYDHIVIVIVNYDCKTFIVQAAGLRIIKHFFPPQSWICRTSKSDS